MQEYISTLQELEQYIRYTNWLWYIKNQGIQSANTENTER